ncbi:hypothetical protein ACFQ38_06795 [Sporosarcina contaminans]|uniref:Uncharacterized protein n=1 Tax=Sporosarcina contaminans TaxID=633403 RepID=A0ABW3TXS4_9BACL
MSATPSKVVLSVFYANPYPILFSFDQVSSEGSTWRDIAIILKTGKKEITQDEGLEWIMHC